MDVTRPRALVLHESMFGHTAAIAAAVASGLADQGYEVECAGVTDLHPSEADADLVVVGAPTHAFSLSRPRTRADAARQGASEDACYTGLREWLYWFRPDDPAPELAVFDTRSRGFRWLPGARHAAARMLRRRGLRLATAPAAFLVDGVRGPLRLDELARAEVWGCNLGARVRDRAGQAPDRAEGTQHVPPPAAAPRAGTVEPTADSRRLQAG